MTTLKPQLVRADTLDLQDVDSPSAKDHTRQPTRTPQYAYGNGLMAPHQAQTLRKAEEEAHHQQSHSPRLGIQPYDRHNEGDQQFYDDPDDEYEDEHPDGHRGMNGAHGPGDDYEDMDERGLQDDDLDDDLMDKISSSPSIEDGKYTPFLWPRRSDSIGRCLPQAVHSVPHRGNSLISSTAHALRHERSEEQGTAQSKHVHSPTASTKYLVPDSPHRHFSTDVQSGYTSMSPEHHPSVESEIYEIEDVLCGDEGVSLDEEHEVDLFCDSSSDDFPEHTLSYEDPRFIDSGWGGECLRDADDIDLDFVYALHTFVATVEGQANATKGDTMVLLDDSNSYWWLVRITKDGSIGYLPAEHIETPTERLARFNKHRNIDLSASMLGDSSEKSKNPLKKAMRRRNAKTVQFTAPTYYEPSDYEYSDEDDMGDSLVDQNDNDSQIDEPDTQQEQRNGVIHANDVVADSRQNIMTDTIMVDKRPDSDDLTLTSRAMSPIKTQTGELASSPSPVDESGTKLRKPSVKGADPFLHDDNLETKKISLTPRLLRGDSDANSSIDQDSRPRTSIDAFDKAVGAEDKSKDDKKKKEKKGVFSFLKRKDKDKSIKSAKGETDDTEKTSDEIIHSPDKGSPEAVTNRSEVVSPDRRPSKLQKKAPNHLLSKSPTGSETKISALGTSPTGTGSQQASTSLQNMIYSPGGVDRDLHGQDLDDATQPDGSTNQVKNTLASPFITQTDRQPLQIQTVVDQNRTGFQQANVQTNEHQRRPQQWSPDDAPYRESSMHPGSRPVDIHRQLAGSVSPIDHDEVITGAVLRSDSAVQISPIEPTRHSGLFGSNMATSGLAINTGPKQLDDDHVSNISEVVTETTPIEAEQTSTTSKESPSTTTQSPSTARSTPTWSDASLRMYMENSQDIKDLLIIVHDRSNVTPVGSDHPLMTNLFVKERSRVNELQTQLDSMLMSWMSKKSPSQS